MRNPYWFPEYTGRKPFFNEMGAMWLNPSHPLNQGLVVWWLMNEGAGLVANNLVDRKKTIVKRVNSFWDKGGLRLNGNAGSETAIDISQFASAATSHTFIYDIERSGLAADANFLLDMLSTGRMTISFLGAANYLRSGEADLGLVGTGRMIIAVVWDGASSKVYGYKNGALLPTTGSYTAVALGTDATLFARYTRDSYCWDGWCYDFEYYPLALPSSIIAVISSSRALYGTPSQPRLLYRGRRAYSVPSAAPSGFKPYWVTRKNRTIGAGVI
jgi:hypothetical protein